MFGLPIGIGASSAGIAEFEHFPIILQSQIRGELRHESGICVTELFMEERVLSDRIPFLSGMYCNCT
jgi:hypothetical protein